MGGSAWTGGQLRSLARHLLGRVLLKDSSLVLRPNTPKLRVHFSNLEEFGLYLHIPFCRQICPYCPYNKQLFDPQVAAEYTEAVLWEVEAYARLAAGIPVTSFYIGGGTPTTMVGHGLGRILDRIYQAFSMRCGIHIESHPNDLTPENLDALVSMGVHHLSVGVEALQDRHLRTLHRPYSVEEAKAAVRRAKDRDFQCLNVDLIFALPGQTCAELEQAGGMLAGMGVDQVAAYPLFEFPYTKWPDLSRRDGHRKVGVLQRRRMLRVLENVFQGAGFERTSVWAFTRRGVPRYCSVTVPTYVGLGASGGTYLNDVFYLNTFSVAEYIRSTQASRFPIALSLDLSERMQMAGWLYWRVYETSFRRSHFLRRFGVEFDLVYGRLFRLLSFLGLVQDRGDQLVLSAAGAYWLHAIQDLFSQDYVSRLWGTSQTDPWPGEVSLAG